MKNSVGFIYRLNPKNVLRLVFSSPLTTASSLWLCVPLVLREVVERLILSMDLWEDLLLISGEDNAVFVEVSLRGISGLPSIRREWRLSNDPESVDSEEAERKEWIGNG